MRCVRLMLPHPWSPTGSLRAKPPHCSAPTAGRTHPFAPAPFAAASATQIARIALAHSDGRKLPRPAKTAVPRRFQRPRCSAYRPRHQHYGARLRLSPRTKAIAPRGFARCKPPALSVRSVISAPPPFRRLHCGEQKQPNSLRKPNWSDTPALDFAACCLGCPITVSRPSFRSVPSAGSQNRWLRAGATVPENEVTRQSC